MRPVSILLVASSLPLATGCGTPACQLASENAACPECADGDVTCTYGDISVTEMSCGGCQAEAGLFAALCAAGVADSRAEIEAGMVCEPVVP